ncbi:MAG: amidohydrolase [Bacteroidales bacterium]|nr:amidohydrolase [Bacteroidales bacterium]
MISKSFLSSLIDLRKDLHRHPELSDHETGTALRIKKAVSPFKPDKIVENIGGNGLALIFKGAHPGPAVMFRCELDALPIDEINNFFHRSEIYGTSHKCGHDGHMAILVGMAQLLQQTPPFRGRVILLFQPAEETGQGAIRVLNDPKFKKLEPDYIFALHNLPGYPKNTLLIKDGVFASASTGLKSHLSGKTSHAAEPEKGLNPALVMANIIKDLEKYMLPGNDHNKIKIVTPIYARLGEKAFGTSPGFAEMMFTIRATMADDFEDIKRFVLETIRKNAELKNIKLENKWVEEFPNTVNDPECNKIVIRAAQESNLTLLNLESPFRWSEDFGHFLANYPGALFGLGSGTGQPALHNPDYDFPDDILETGIKIFYNIYKIIQN